MARGFGVTAKNLCSFLDINIREVAVRQNHCRLAVGVAC